MKKIKVDFDLCESSAMCEALATDYFQVDENDYLQILQEDVPDEHLSVVEQAVASCPRSAISLAEE